MQIKRHQQIASASAGNSVAGAIVSMGCCSVRLCAPRQSPIGRRSPLCQSYIFFHVASSPPSPLIWSTRNKGQPRRSCGQARAYRSRQSWHSFGTQPCISSNLPRNANGWLFARMYARACERWLTGGDPNDTREFVFHNAGAQHSCVLQIASHCALVDLGAHRKKALAV